MARRCELTGKSVMTGNNVSHAQNKTRRRFRPNLHAVSLQSEALGETVRLRVSSAALRSVEKLGGLDGYLRKAPEGALSLRAARVKRRIARSESQTGAAEASPPAAGA